jgi:hypothetical protein
MRPFASPDGWTIVGEDEATHAYDDFEDEILHLATDEIPGFDNDRYVPVIPE